MTSLKATVVIPTYNRAEKLRRLLHCLTHQDRELLVRVVVCDDGSTDDTESSARAFASQLPIEYAWQPDDGFRAGQARNLGIERAAGDIVIFVDDDVLLMPNFVKAHLDAHACATTERSVAIGYRHRTVDFHGRIPDWEDIVGAEREDRLIDLQGPIEKQAAPWIYVYSCNFSVTLGGPELRFDDGFSGWGMEDTELGYRLHQAGYQLIEAQRARVLHLEDPHPRDPFRCETVNVPPTYDSYVENAVYFMDKYPHDAKLAHFIRQDLRWYVLNEGGHWVKNGYANDVDLVIDRCRERLRVRSIPAHRTEESAAQENLIS